MSFKFDNHARFVRRYRDLNWYDWKVFMDEPEEKLEKVKSVEYQLHRTFPDPIRVVEDKNSHFALQSSGWGEFTIYITTYLKDGNEEHTEYNLDLSKPVGDLV